MGGGSPRVKRVSNCSFASGGNGLILRKTDTSSCVEPLTVDLIDDFHSDVSVGTGRPLPPGIDGDEIGSNAQELGSLFHEPVNVFGSTDFPYDEPPAEDVDVATETGLPVRVAVESMTSSADVEGALLDARWNNSGVKSLQLPWEKGVMKSIFSSGNGLVDGGLKKVEPLWRAAELSACEGPCESAPKRMVTEPAGHAIDNPVYERAIAFGRGFRTTVETDLTLKRWVAIFSQNLSGSAIGLSLAIASNSEETMTAVQEIFAGKSAATLIKRARCTKRMMTWSLEKLGTATIFPLKTPILLAYIRSLRDSEKYSAIRETLETVAFLIHVAGVEADSNILGHPQVRGLARLALTSRPEIKQSRVLTVVEVLALE